MASTSSRAMTFDDIEAFGVRPPPKKAPQSSKVLELAVSDSDTESDTSSTTTDSAFGPDRPSTPPASATHKCCGQAFASQAYIKHVHVYHREEARRYLNGF